MNNQELNKAFESFNPTDEQKKRMFDNIMNLSFEIWNYLDFLLIIIYDINVKNQCYNSSHDC